MNASPQSLKIPSKIALAAIGALFILAAIFYRERILFSDAAFYMFDIVDRGGFCIQHNRYGAFVTQLLPWIAVKAHLPLKTVLISYAVNFNLFYVVVVSILVFGFKQYRLALLMTLYYFLLVSESFIWLSEIPQAVAWMFLFFGTAMFLGGKRANILLLFVSLSVLAFLTFSSHFIVTIPALYLWVYLMLEKKNWPFSNGVSILLSLMIVMVIGLKFLMQSSYEGEHLRGLTHFSLQDIIDVFTKPVIKVFAYLSLVNYWLAVLIFIAGIVSLIRSNQKLLAVWTAVTVVGYIIIMGLTYGDLDAATQLFHIESEWSCIGIIIATPFVFALLPEIKTSIASYMLAGIFVTRLVYIISFLPPFTTRINMTEQILVQMRKKGITKLALYNDAHLMAISKLYWGLPFESLFLSSMEGDKPQLTFMFVNPDDKRVLEVLKDPNGFFDSYTNFPCSQLNKEYFQVDSTKPYQVMSYAELLK